MGGFLILTNLNTLYKSQDRPQNGLELSRSCVSQQFRKKNVLHLMWSKINEYVQHNKNDVLFGMASFLEENPNIIKEELSYLYQKFLIVFHQLTTNNVDNNF